MKKNKVLIIEDEINHYIYTKRVLENDYDIFPETEEDFNSFLKVLNEEDDSWKIKLGEMIDGLELPDAIICDLHFTSDPEKGFKIIKYLRNEYVNEKLPHYGKIVSILASTNYTNKKHLAEKLGAVSCSKFFDDAGNIKERGKVLFEERLENQIKYYHTVKDFIHYVVPVYEKSYRENEKNL